MKYTGQIQECKVLYDNPFDLWHPLFLVTAKQQIEQCLMSLPCVPTRDVFLKGMMSLTRGHINPTLVLEVYDSVVSDVVLVSDNQRRFMRVAMEQGKELEPIGRLCGDNFVLDTELEHIILDNIDDLYEE